jgi:hypothetical protein
MITVVFSKDGFHHVSVGRLGTREPEKGMPYQLPEAFAGIIPSRTRVFDPDSEKDRADLEDILEEFGLRRPVRPQIVDQEALDSLVKTHAQRTRPPSEESGAPSIKPDPEPAQAEDEPKPARRQRRRQAA